MKLQQFQSINCEHHDTRTVIYKLLQPTRPQSKLLPTRKVQIISNQVSVVQSWF